jgi:hypothetical protein
VRTVGHLGGGSPATRGPTPAQGARPRRHPPKLTPLHTIPWQAVFGPKGNDGYPARIWYVPALSRAPAESRGVSRAQTAPLGCDCAARGVAAAHAVFDRCKDPSPEAGCEYGAINKTVAAYWKQHFDLFDRIRSQWRSGLGAKLSGKLHVYVGGADSFFLTNAVMDLQDWVASEPGLTPPFGGEILIGAHDGRGFEHCFNGYLPDGTVAPNAVTRACAPMQPAPRPPARPPSVRANGTGGRPSRLVRAGELYVTKFLPRMAKRWAASAPPGANMEWNSY